MTYYFHIVMTNYLLQTAHILTSTADRSLEAIARTEENTEIFLDLIQGITSKCVLSVIDNSSLLYENSMSYYNSYLTLCNRRTFEYNVILYIKFSHNVFSFFSIFVLLKFNSKLRSLISSNAFFLR
jgi:hypothetical protein